MAGKPVFHNDVFFLGRMSVTYFNPTSGQWLYLIHEGKSSCNICLYPSIHPFVLLCVSLTVFVYIPFGHLVYSFTWSTDILITSQNGGTRLLDCVWYTMFCVMQDMDLHGLWWLSLFAHTCTDRIASILLFDLFYSLLRWKGWRVTLNFI